MLPKRKHVLKYADLYLEQGFDVVVVSITPWQLLWPTKGSRVNTRNINYNTCYINIHITYNLICKSFLLAGCSRLDRVSDKTPELSTNTITWIFSSWIYVGRSIGFNAE